MLFLQVVTLAKVYLQIILFHKEHFKLIIFRYGLIYISLTSQQIRQSKVRLLQLVYIYRQVHEFQGHNFRLQIHQHLKEHGKLIWDLNLYECLLLYFYPMNTLLIHFVENNGGYLITLLDYNLNSEQNIYLLNQYKDMQAIIKAL